MTSQRPTLRGKLVPTAVAALALGISEAGVRQLARRGRLTRHGSPQRARYDLGELIERLALERTTGEDTER